MFYTPKAGYEFWYVTQYGDLRKTIHSAGDGWLFKYNPIFKTEDEVREYRLFLRLVDKHIKPFKAGKRNYYLYYNYKEDKIEYTYNMNNQVAKFYFGEKKANIERFLKNANEDDIKKYLFGKDSKK